MGISAELPANTLDVIKNGQQAIIPRGQLVMKSPIIIEDGGVLIVEDNATLILED